MKNYDDRFIKRLFVMTNEEENSIVCLIRHDNGKLSYDKIYKTSGKGLCKEGNNNLLNNTPLLKQNSLITSLDKKYLFALNMGSNEISSFKIEDNNLKLIDVVSSNGICPNSMAILNNHLFVTNLGDEHNKSNVSGFYIKKDGHLSAISYDYLPQKHIKSQALCITSLPQSRKIVITDFSANYIIIYNLDKKGYFKDCKINISTTPNPMSITNLCSDLFLVSEFPSNSLSIYNVDKFNNIYMLDRSDFKSEYGISTLSTSYCNKYAYVTNSNSGTVSTYKIENNMLTLIESVPTTYDLKGCPIGSAIDKYDKFLYVLNKNSNSIVSYKIQCYGQLSMIDIFENPLLYKSSCEGIAIV